MYKEISLIASLKAFFVSISHWKKKLHSIFHGCWINHYINLCNFASLYKKENLKKCVHSIGKWKMLMKKSWFLKLEVTYLLLVHTIFN